MWVVRVELRSVAEEHQHRHRVYFSTGGFIEIGRRQKLVTVYVVRGELTKPRQQVNVFPDLLQGRPHGRAPRLRLGGVLSHMKKKKKYQTG